MSFSTIKGPFCDPYTYSLIIKSPNHKTVFIKSRSSTILSEFIGKTVAVYNGKEYKTFGVITPNHVGHKFGEFSPTKKPAIYKNKKLKKK